MPLFFGVTLFAIIPLTFHIIISMPTTRRQAAIAEGRISSDKKSASNSETTHRKNTSSNNRKRKVDDLSEETDEDTKLVKFHPRGSDNSTRQKPLAKKARRAADDSDSVYKAGWGLTLFLLNKQR